MTVAGVAELADAHDSKSCGEIRAGSSPATGIAKVLYQESTPIQCLFALYKTEVCRWML